MIKVIIKKFTDSELLKPHKNGYVVNLCFFEGFQQNFISKVKQENGKRFNFKHLFILYNEMIENNSRNMINKETVYEFLNILIKKNKLYFADDKKELFSLF